MSDVTHLLDGLNDRQRDAVAAEPQHRLILAGAGSGKTRVLVHRIAWLQEVFNVPTHAILAVTFTNKAAAEMRARVQAIQGGPVGAAMWVGTFHGICHRLLRMHPNEARLPDTFQILDSEDQKRLVRRVIRSMELDEARWPPKQMQWFINGQKDEGVRPQHMPDYHDESRSTQKRIYMAYEEACQRAGVVDFAELLLRAHEMLRDNPQLLAHYHRRFAHILVDEFQDTNTLQYAWVRLLAGETGKVFVVGDDDQSIYGWRGAKVENIQQVEKDFPGAEVVRLEQNYRSTSNILNAANAVIANNSGRLGKDLWTEAGEGELVTLYSAFNEYEEAQFAVDTIRSWVRDGGKRDETAILYRSNAQSRIFEQMLIDAQMPYRVYGGLRFFERQEIKDALAYLRLTENRRDDPSFERVVNVPTRGVGNQTIEKVRAVARDQKVSMWEAAVWMIAENLLAPRAAKAVNGFLELVDKLEAGGLTEAHKPLPLNERVDHVITYSGLIEHYEKDKDQKGETRIENLHELVNAAKAFAFRDVEPVAEGEPELPELSEFLAHASLEAGDRQSEEWEDCVQLMTMHSAKGLEFPLVFVSGLEEGLFPHQNSIDDPGGLEEERRLAYVGMTRAMQKLYLSYAESRRIYGKETYARRSRFLDEVPAEYLVEVRPRAQVSAPVYNPRNVSLDEAPSGLALGQSVNHAKFGGGVVLNFEGAGASARVQVNFDSAGSKWLVLQYANLQAL
jgi:DNA helicase-2/ATP-dependent DNA helicase PcrA